MKEPATELQLLICVARKDLDEPTKARLRELARSQLDWPKVYRLAAKHGLVPLLYRHLTSDCRDLVPSEFLHSLSEEFERNNARNLFMVSEFLNVVRHLRHHQIESVSLKGPLLAERVYGGLGLRTVADIDLLINKHHFYEARDLLEQNGYVMEPPLTSAQVARHLEFHCEIQLINQQLDTVIDLHWALAPLNFSGALDTDAVFSRKSQMSVGGQSVDILDNEDLLLFLSMHAAKHYWSRLEWLAAIAELLRDSRSIDARQLLARARTVRAETMLLLAAVLSHKLFGVRLPDELGRAVIDQTALQSRAAYIQEHLLKEESNSLDQWQMFRMNLLAMDRRRYALGALLRSIFTPTIPDWELISFPRPLYPIYYFFRPIRLSAKYLGRLFGNSRTIPNDNQKRSDEPVLSRCNIDA